MKIHLGGSKIDYSHEYKTKNKTNLISIYFEYILELMKIGNKNVEHIFNIQ